MQFLLSLFTELISIVGGGVGGAFNLVVNIMQKGFGAAVQFHQEGIALARDLGLSASQAQAYTQALTESTAKLANKYGVTADAIKEVQRGIAESTNRQLLLNDAQREQLVISNKLVGSQTTNAFTSEIMTHLGGQVSTVEGAISKAYATAAKQGLNAQKFSATVAKNLSMANKLSFRDGVNGIIRMTALSEKLGFNLQSVESAASKFMELDSAIESSAQLQMLGGAAGAYGSNPLTMAYEANYDPEAFTERMTKMLGGYAQFDENSGMARIGGMNMDFVRNIAKAMGISPDEAASIAKKQAEVKYKENAYGASFANLSAEKKDFIMNKSYVEDGRLYINDASGKKHDITNGLSKGDEAIIKELQQYDKMSDHDLMVKQAEALTSLPEQIDGAASTVAASFAEGIEDYIPGFREQVREIGNFLSGHAKNWGQSVGQILDAVLTFLKEKGPKILDTTERIFNGIDKLIDTVGPIAKWIAENPWESLFIYIAGKAALKTLIKHPKGVASGVGSAARGIGRAIGSVARGIGRAGNLLFKAIGRLSNGIGRAGSSLFKALGRINFKSIGTAISKAIKPILRFGSKIAKIGGGVLSSVLSVGMAGLDVKSIKEQLNELDRKYENGEISKEEYDRQSRELTIQKNEAMGSGTGAVAGAALGSLIGPEGTFIGGIIGDILGGLAGKIWNSVSTTISDFWNGTVRDIAGKAFGKLGTDFVDRVSIMTDAITSGYGTILERTLNGIGTLLSGYWDGIKTLFNGWLDGLSKIFKGDFIEGAITIIKAQGEASWKIIESTVSGVWQTFTAPFFGLVELLKGGWKLVTRSIDEAKANIKQGWDNAMKVFSILLHNSKKAITEAIEIIKEIWDTVSNTVSELWANTIDGIKNAWDEKIAQPAAALWEGIKNAWNENITQPFKEYVIQPIKDGIKWLDENIWQPVKSFFAKVKEGWDKLMGGIQKFLDDPWGTIKQGANNKYEEAKDWAKDKYNGAKDWIKEKLNFSVGGIVGGNSYSGDRVLTGLNSGEMILNASQQSSLFSFISSIPSIMSSMLNNRNDVKAKPVGEREYIYTPSNTNRGNGITELTVRDINVNVNGTLKLDAGNFTKNIDINQLLNDSSFVSQLKDLIKESINNDINNGRFMNDIASMRGMPSQVGLWGRK